MDKKYNPSSFEDRIYKTWLERNYFEAKINKDKTPFTIIMPPPNITSKLHMGHAFQQTIQDIIIRRKRMQGYEALWLPGTDHAAIATEAKVVEKLAKEGISKEDIGREEFSKHIADWYREYKDTIINQFKRMGYSCDWSRLAFTMDDLNCRAVRKVFVGYIYRGKRIVNWCPHCKTSISDIEIDYKENHSHLWHLRYQIEGTDRYIELATTRPETMLGDTAVAVNPNDDRYKDVVGKNVVLPIVNKLIPIVADDYVDMSFGTGVVKITPAHDPNDFEVGLRHNLESICVIGLDGKMNENALEYEGLDRYEARAKIIEKLDKIGNLVKIEDYSNNVGHCDRCKTVIEPMISSQWFVKMSELAKPAIEVVEKDKVHFIEPRYKKIYLHWMNNIKDWCISRQLWSGHRIPIFTCEDCGEVIVELADPTVCPKCGSKHLVQDEDTLDTWFSSALWPFSTLGFPDKTPELEYFYPTNVMVTAQEIIQLWVARMIFSGLEHVGQIPFREVLINGTVKDAHGKKMSKSLGNGVDPVEIIEQYGVDTLRFSLFNGVSIDMDSKFSEKKVELSKNFLNKVWNASQFVLMQTEGVEFTEDITSLQLSDADKWILTELNNLIKSVNKKFDKYDIGMAASELYDFFWTKFCDWYIELSKVTLKTDKKTATANVLVYVLSQLLKMLHPFIPFITEEIYLNLPIHDESIVITSFPEESDKLDFADTHALFEEIRDSIKSVRNIRAEMNVADNVKTNILVLPVSNNEFVSNNIAFIEKLAGGKSISLLDNDSTIDSSFVSIVNNITKLYIPIGDMQDIEKEIERLNNELKTAESEIARATGKINNKGFVEKAPQALVDAEKDKIKKYTDLKESILEQINKLKK